MEVKEEVFVKRKIEVVLVILSPSAVRASYALGILAVGVISCLERVLTFKSVLAADLNLEAFFSLSRFSLSSFSRRNKVRLSHFLDELFSGLVFGSNLLA